MRRYSYEAWTDGRPVRMPMPECVSATSFGVAFRKAARAIKHQTRRGTKQITIKLTDLGTVKKPVNDEEKS